MAQGKQAPITPLSLPRDTTGVIVFGGTFDPPHLWHTRAASAARRQLFEKGGVVVLVPAARSPHKSRGPTASDEDRVAMLRLATRRMERCIVWTDEIDRAKWHGNGAPSYTIDTMQRLHRALALHSRGKQLNVRLLIGADQAAAFHKWKDWQTLFRANAPATISRPPMNSPEALARALRDTAIWSEPEITAWCNRIVKLRPRDLSSTAVRQSRSLTTGKSSGAEQRTTRAVAAYIKSHDLYAAQDQVVKPRKVGV